MAKTAPDTSFRSWPIEELNAVKASILLQLKTIEGVGQAHSVSGRNTALADFDKLMDKLTSINAALAYKRNCANRGNNGYTSRIASFGLP